MFQRLSPKQPLFTYPLVSVFGPRRIWRRAVMCSNSGLFPLVFSDENFLLSGFSLGHERPPNPKVQHFLDPSSFEVVPFGT